MADGLTGIASGVDTDAIVTKLMDAERIKRTRMDWTQAQITARSTGLASVQTKLLALRTAVQGLRDVGTWADTQTVESSDTRVAARRTAGAAAGGFTVDVVALARAEQRTYAYTPPAAADAISVGGTTVDIAAGATLADAVSAINGTAGSPVYAAAVDGQLVLSSRKTGAANGFTATGGALAEDASRARLGQDASYRIDGGAIQASASNVVANGVPGVELTLKGVTTGAASVTVGAPGPDPKVVQDKVQAFVTAYNDLVTTTRALTSEQKVVGASTAEDFAKGALHADSGLNTLLSQLRQNVMDPVAGNPAALDQLAELGITTGAVSSLTSDDSKAGLLTFDTAKLTDALADPQAVRKLLGGIASSPGMAQRLETTLGGYLGAAGTLTKRLGEAGSQTTDLQAQMTREDQRLAAVETRLKAQFAAMETALANAQSQQAWLTGQLNALA